MAGRAWVWAMLLLACAPAAMRAADLPHTVWLEAETFGPLHGSNFSYQHPEQTTKGSWSVAGPGVAAEWTQGGESEWMSIAARADEPGEVVCGRDVELPAAGRYTLWVRYADYRNKKESFGIRIRQGDRTIAHVFGEHPVIDELDPMKLRWDWAFGWDHAEVEVAKGPARVELYTTGPTEARRQVDCLCLTTDGRYHPTGREKPDCAAWLPLRDAAAAGMPTTRPLAHPLPMDHMPDGWRIADGPPSFLWNVGDPWFAELKRPAGDRVEWPFTADPPLEAAFVQAFRGKDLAVYGDALSGPAPHVRHYPAVFAPGSAVGAWLDRHPERRFAILLNYGDPEWPKDADKSSVYDNLKKYKDRFAGFIAGENMSYDATDNEQLNRDVRAARTRGEVLSAVRRAHDAATASKYSGYFGRPVTAAEAWATDVPCLSGGMEAYAHALADWGVRRIGHENTGNSPTLARRLAFLRGAARQFGAHLCDYQSANLGDASMIFSRQASFYPANARYIIDNQYDAWAGAGLNWVLKDYLLFWLAGADTFYHEEGGDIYWKPGGNAAGDDYPIALSPRGRVTQAVMQLARDHRVGTQLTPIAFVMDEAHGWSQERFSPASFGLDRELNPSLLTPGPHEAAIRGWFDVAYYPAPQTQDEPASGVRQTFVNGIFGDIFDVIVTAPQRSDIARTYPVLIALGEVPLTEPWGAALDEDVAAGATLVVCADQFTGPGAGGLNLPAGGAAGEADGFTWMPNGQRVASNVFRYRALPYAGATVLARAPDGTPIVVARKHGHGRIVFVGIPLGLGIDQRPVPVLSLLMRHLADGLLPVKVVGDVEWTLNRLDDGTLLVALLNNAGVHKPQHGDLPTDGRAARDVTLSTGLRVSESPEWVTHSTVHWDAQPGGALAHITLPAGSIRLIAIPQS